MTLENIYYRFLILVIPPENPLPEDPLTRYLKNPSKDFDPKTREVSASAFLPNQNVAVLTKSVSVFNISGMNENSVWNMGRLWTVINPWPKRSGTRPIRARADIKTSMIIDIEELDVKSVPSPHPRHVELRNWPPDESQQLSAALQIAQKSTFKPAPR